MLTSQGLREELFLIRDKLVHNPYYYFPDWIRDLDLNSVADQPLIYLNGGYVDHALWLFLRHEKSSRFNRLAIVDDKRVNTGFQGEKVISLESCFDLIKTMIARDEEFICINFSMEQDDYLRYKYMATRYDIRMLDWAEALRLPTFKELQMGVINSMWDGVLERFDEFIKSEFLLKDELSKLTLFSVILYRLTLKREYLWPPSVPLSTSYFHSGLFDLGNDEIFVDVGAFNGDTLRGFTFATQGKFRHYYGFEPSEHNFKSLHQNRAMMGLPERNVTLEQQAVGSASGEVPFIADQGGGSHVVGKDGPGVGTSVLGAGRQEKQVTMVPAISLDEYFQDKEPASLIKLDVEGEEMSVLRGAEGLLKKHKPKLAVCAYHLPTDIPDILHYLSSLDLGYKFGLRHHNNSHWDTVIYASVD